MILSCFGLLLQTLLFGTQINKELKVEKLKNEINLENYDEINPIISRDGHTLYFTRVGHPNFNRTLIQDDKDLSKTLGFEEYQKVLAGIYSILSKNQVTNPEKNSFNQDIWEASWITNDFGEVKHPNYPLNNALPNSVCSITPEQNELIVINEYYKDGSLYSGFSTIKKNTNSTWQFPKPLFIHDYYSRSNDVNLTMNENGKIIILSLNRPTTQGSNDLYICFKMEDNLFSAPMHLNGDVNSEFRETTPFISRDGNFLYFSSDRPGGLGGNDIYVSERLDDSWLNWTKPQTLPFPINSAFDDSQPFLNEAHGYVYFTSKREGSSDIYRVRFHPIDETHRKKTLNIQVINALTGLPEDCELAMGFEKDGYFNKSNKAILGNYVYQFLQDDNIIVKPKKKGFESVRVAINISTLYNDGGTFKDYTLYIEPIEKEATFSLDKIYFYQSTSTIKDESFPYIDVILNTMAKNPKLNIKITGHTDNVGSQKSLVKLSADRANAIKEYLVLKGIEPYRITASGEGSNFPLNDNSTEEEKSKNRRVEFTVFK